MNSRALISGTLEGCFSNPGSTPKSCPCRQNDGTSEELSMVFRSDALTADGGIGTRCHQSNDVVFENGEVGLVENDFLKTSGVFFFGALCSRGLDGRSSTEIEGFRLKSRPVGVATHLSAQSVDFIDEMAFGESTDRGVARHLSDGGFLRCYQQSRNLHPCSGQGRFGAGVSAADYDQRIDVC